jgi:outer membrane protein
MNFKSLIAPLAALCLIAAAGAPHALAQGAAPRIAVVKTGRVFLEMRETQELRASLESEGNRLKNEEKQKRDAIQSLQNERNQLKPDSPKWDELNNRLMDQTLEFQLWVQQTKARAERSQKRQVKALFDQIQQAVEAVAQREGYDLILADQHPELPDNLDQVNIDQVRALLNSRTILFAANRIDVSDAVLKELDARFKSRGGSAAPAAPTGGTGAAPAPAPAPAPGGRRPPAPAPAPAPRQQ